MSLTQKMRNVSRALVQRYGPKPIKRYLWNREFAAGRWDCLDKTGGERGHAQIEKYAANGHILDLGCGSGTTSVELNPAAYSRYTGVDISDVAVQKAKDRAREAGRADRNDYYLSDIATYMPKEKYEVILFGDSIYYVPHNQLDALLKRYSEYLSENGVFVVRMHDTSGKHRRIVDAIESHYQLVEKDSRAVDQSTACVIVFRPVSTQM